MQIKTLSGRGRRLLVMLAAALLGACATPLPVSTGNSGDFKVTQRTLSEQPLTDPDALALFDEQADPIYRIGPGDHLTVLVWGRPELSGKLIVGPDGQVGLPLIGTIKVLERTRDEVADDVGKRLAQYYSAPHVTVSIDQFSSNRIILLGRVERAGLIQFDGKPTLLEALARAGALPVLDKKALLTRCSIIRGRDQVIWVDLKRLLNAGDQRYNLTLKSNDVVYIPDSDDMVVYVMGQALRPGPLRLTPDMTLLDALGQAGGLNEDAAPEELAVYRPRTQSTHAVPLKALLAGDKTANVVLQDGDVVYVPKSTLGNIGYFVRQVIPGLAFFLSNPLMAPTTSGK